MQTALVLDLSYRSVTTMTHWQRPCNVSKFVSRRQWVKVFANCFGNVIWRLESWTYFSSINVRFLYTFCAYLYSKREISAETFQLHEAHCSRNITLCELCQEPVPLQQREEHYQRSYQPVSMYVTIMLSLWPLYMTLFSQS